VPRGKQSNGTFQHSARRTEEGTVLVEDIWPGSSSSVPRAMANVGGTLFFAANDGIHGQELWKATVNSAQLLAPIPDQTIPSNQVILTVPLSATGNPPLTFSATAQSLAYVLTQQTGTLTYASGWDNWGGEGTKWLQASSGQWYFILASGDLYRWDGSDGANGTLLGMVGSSFYIDPTRLSNPPANQPHATLSLSGNTLTISRDADWISCLIVTVTVTDGASLTDTKTFNVFVTP
jgi:hypothetical protein